MAWWTSRCNRGSNVGRVLDEELGHVGGAGALGRGDDEPKARGVAGLDRKCFEEFAKESLDRVRPVSVVRERHGWLLRRRDRQLQACMPACMHVVVGGHGAEGEHGD